MSAQLLRQLRDKGISIWDESGALGYRAPKGRLTPEVKLSIVKSRKTLIAALGAEISDLDRRCDQLLEAYPDMGRRYRKELWWALCSIPGWRDGLTTMEKSFMAAFDCDADCYAEFQALRKHWQAGIRAATSSTERKAHD